MLNNIKRWFERVLEKPFYEAEIIRADILKEHGGKKSTTPGKIPARLRQV